MRALAGDTFSSLAVADHRRLFFGNMAFQISIWMQQLVFGWLLLELGDSPFWLGMGGLSSGAAMMLFSPVSGALADSWERRRVLILTQLMALLVNAGVAILVWLGWLAIWHLLLASFVMGCSFTLNLPARQSLTLEIVGRRLLHNATALHTASLNFSRITGPAAAGALLALLGPQPVTVLNLAANVWTVRQLTRIDYRPPRREAANPFRGTELLEGFRFCWRERAVRRILVAVGITYFFGASYVQLLPALARDVLGVGPEGLGLLSSATGGGALVGSLLLARFAGIPRKEQLLQIAAVLLGLCLIGVGLENRLVPSMFFLALSGASSAVVVSLGIAAIQNLVPDHLSGRVFSVYSLTLGLMPLGGLPVGLLASEIGTGPAVAVSGLVCALGSGVLLGMRRRSWPGPTTKHG